MSILNMSGARKSSSTSTQSTAASAPHWPPRSLPTGRAVPYVTSARHWGWTLYSWTTSPSPWPGGIAQQTLPNVLRNRAWPDTARRPSCSIHWCNRRWVSPDTCRSTWVVSLSPAALSLRWCRWRMPAWMTVPSFSGTKKTSSPWACSRWMYSRSACCLLSEKACKWLTATAPPSTPSATFPNRTSPLTACCNKRTPSACFKSSHAHRCPYCHGSSPTVFTTW